MEDNNDIKKLKKKEYNKRYYDKKFKKEQPTETLYNTIDDNIIYNVPQNTPIIQPKKDEQPIEPITIPNADESDDEELINKEIEKYKL